MSGGVFKQALAVDGRNENAMLALAVSHEKIGLYAQAMSMQEPALKTRRRLLGVVTTMAEIEDLARRLNGAPDRLVVKVWFPGQQVYVRFVGTHQEYDRLVKELESLEGAFPELGG